MSVCGIWREIILASRAHNAPYVNGNIERHLKNCMQILVLFGHMTLLIIIVLQVDAPETASRSWFFLDIMPILKNSPHSEYCAGSRYCTPETACRSWFFLDITPILNSPHSEYRAPSRCSRNCMPVRILFGHHAYSTYRILKMAPK